MIYSTHERCGVTPHSGELITLAPRDSAGCYSLAARTHAEQRRQDLEPDLERAWQLLDVEHIVVVTPVWWGSVPALLKGFFDRLLLPKRGYLIKPSGLPQGLLAGRTGRLIVTTDSPLWYLPLVGDTTVRHVRQLTMRFCAIRPVRAARIGPVKHSTLEQRERWLAKVAGLGRADAVRPSRKIPV